MEHELLEGLPLHWLSLNRIEVGDVQLLDAEVVAVRTRECDSIARGGDERTRDRPIGRPFAGTSVDGAAARDIEHADHAHLAVHSGHTQD